MQAAAFVFRRMSMLRPSTTRHAQFATQVVARADMPFLHHGKRPRHRGYVKFKSPRKRASKLLDELNKEAAEKSKAANPAMWDAGFRVGDSIEIKMVTQGGAVPREGFNQDIEKIRGVVLGIVNRGLASSVIIRDVVYGLPIERKIPMHSPMVKDCQVLERNFIFKGKKKVKRAKLYYFRNLNPLRKCWLRMNSSWCVMIMPLTQTVVPTSEQGVQVLKNRWPCCMYQSRKRKTLLTKKKIIITMKILQTL